MSAKRTLLPIHPFSQQREADIPFEIGRIEGLPSAARTAQPHRHTFYEIFWLTGGAGQHIIDFEPHPIRPNTLYFISPGQIHAWALLEPPTGYALLFTEEFVTLNQADMFTPRSFDFFHRPDRPPLLCVAPDATGQFGTLCAEMLREYQAAHEGRFIVLQAQLRILLVWAQRQYTQDDAGVWPRAATHPLVAAYIRLIDAHFREYQQVGDYAKLLVKLQNKGNRQTPPPLHSPTQAFGEPVGD